MRDKQFIPEKIKLNVRRGYSEVPRAFPSPLSTTPGVQKEISRTIGYMPDAVEYDNIPLDGYHIMVERENVEVFHPDGYSISLTKYNIGIILRECQINQGMIQDKLLFIFDKTYKEYILVPYGHDTYKEVKVESDNFYAAKSGAVELSYGCCVDFGGRKFTYAGTYWISTIGKTGMRIVDRFLLRSGNGHYYITTVKLPDAITDEKIIDIPDEDKVLKDVEQKGLQEITTFYKTGSYNSRTVKFDRLYISKEKPKKKDFEFGVSYSKEPYGYSLAEYPIFLSDDGNHYAAIDYYGYKLITAIHGSDIGKVAKAVPFDVSTLTADKETKEHTTHLKNVTTQKIVKLAFPKLVKK